MIEMPMYLANFQVVLANGSTETVSASSHEVGVGGNLSFIRTTVTGSYNGNVYEHDRFLEFPAGVWVRCEKIPGAANE